MRAILNPLMAGLDKNGEPIEDFGETVLTPDEHQRLNALFAKRRGEQTPPREPFDYLLTSGLSECGRCAFHMQGARVNGDADPGYRCPPPKEGRASCGGVRMNANRLEDAVAEQVLADVLRPGTHERLLEVQEDVRPKQDVCASMSTGPRSGSRNWAACTGVACWCARRSWPRRRPPRRICGRPGPGFGSWSRSRTCRSPALPISSRGGGPLRGPLSELSSPWRFPRCVSCRQVVGGTPIRTSGSLSTGVPPPTDLLFVRLAGWGAPLCLSPCPASWSLLCRPLPSFRCRPPRGRGCTTAPPGATATAGSSPLMGKPCWWTPSSRWPACVCCWTQSRRRARSGDHYCGEFAPERGPHVGNQLLPDARSSRRLRRPSMCARRSARSR